MRGSSSEGKKAVCGISPAVIWMFTSRIFPSAVPRDLIWSQTVRNSSSSQSVASPSVMLKTMGGKLAAWAASAHHAAARSRMRRSASHMGVCPAACGSTQIGTGSSRRAMPPSGVRHSTTSRRMAGSTAASSVMEIISRPSGSREWTSSSPE